jgi:hypothetical protein
VEVLLKAHEFAWSRRTSGFPLVIYDEGGKELLSLRTQKRAMVVEVPDTSRFLAWFYRSFSGRPSVRLYRVPELDLVKLWDERHAEEIVQLPSSQLNDDIKAWILG